MNVVLKKLNKKNLLEKVDTYKRLDGLLLAKVEGEWIPASRVLLIEQPLNWHCSCGGYLEASGWCSNCNYTLPTSSIEKVLELAE